MVNKLFVSNLAWEVNDEKLAEIFGSFGKVINASVILDKMTGKSRGFGFVEFEKPEEAKEAMDKMNGVLVMGRSLRIAEALPKKEYTPGR